MQCDECFDEVVYIVGAGNIYRQIETCTSSAGISREGQGLQRLSQLPFESGPSFSPRNSSTLAEFDFIFYGLRYKSRSGAYRIRMHLPNTRVEIFVESWMNCADGCKMAKLTTLIELE